MTSFVNMMGFDVWNETDIINRTEALIRTKYSQEEEMILNRKISGMQLGLYTLTADEQAEMSDFNVTVLNARTAGDAARADMALLQQALNVEAAQTALNALPPAPTDGSTDPDADQRAALQAQISGAPQNVTDLVTQRAAYFASLLPPPPPPVDPNAPTDPNAPAPTPAPTPAPAP
jgi:hypothetical protein